MYKNISQPTILAEQQFFWILQCQNVYWSQLVFIDISVDKQRQQHTNSQIVFIVAIFTRNCYLFALFSQINFFALTVNNLLFSFTRNGRQTNLLCPRTFNFAYSVHNRKQIQIIKLSHHCSMAIDLMINRFLLHIIIIYIYYFFAVLFGPEQALFINEVRK